MCRPKGSITVATARGFLKFPDFFLTNVKFPWTSEFKISQISPDNWLIAPLRAIPPIHPFIHAFRQVTCNVHELIVPYKWANRTDFFENPTSACCSIKMNNILPIQHDSFPKERERRGKKVKLSSFCAWFNCTYFRPWLFKRGIALFTG